MRKIRKDKNVYIPSAYPHVELLEQREMESHDFKHYCIVARVSFFFRLFFFFFININFTIMLKRASMK